MIRRFAEWLVDRLGGEIDWGIEYYGPTPKPDYYVDGCAVYDMGKITELDPDPTAFKTMLEKLQ